MKKLHVLLGLLAGTSLAAAQYIALGSSSYGICYRRSETTLKLEVLGEASDANQCGGQGGDRWEQQTQGPDGQWEVNFECDLVRFESPDLRVICVPDSMAEIGARQGGSRCQGENVRLVRIRSRHECVRLPLPTIERTTVCYDYKDEEIEAVDWYQCGEVGGSMWVEAFRDDSGEWLVDKECLVIPTEIDNNSKLTYIQKCGSDGSLGNGIAATAASGTSGVGRAWQSQGSRTSRGCAERGGRWQNVGSKLKCLPQDVEIIIQETTTAAPTYPNVTCYGSLGEHIRYAFDFLSCALKGGKVYEELSLNSNGDWTVDRECEVIQVANGEVFRKKCDTDEAEQSSSTNIRFSCQFYEGETLVIDRVRQCVPITFKRGVKESFCYDKSSELIEVNLDFVECAERGGKYWDLQQRDPTTGEWVLGENECIIDRNEGTGLPICQIISSAADAVFSIASSSVGGVTRATQAAVPPPRLTCVGRNRRWIKVNGGKHRCLQWPLRQKRPTKKKSSSLIFFPSD